MHFVLEAAHVRGHVVARAHEIGDEELVLERGEARLRGGLHLCGLELADLDPRPVEVADDPHGEDRGRRGGGQPERQSQQNARFHARLRARTSAFIHRNTPLKPTK